MLVFLKALSDGKLIQHESLDLMHQWRHWRFPLDYGYGTMHFGMPGLVNSAAKKSPIWGYSGSIGSVVYVSDDLNLYVAGRIDSAGSEMPAFMLAINALRTVASA